MPITLADAIIDENVAAVSEILQYGVDINEVDEYGFTYLIEAAIADNIDIAKLLINAGADVNLQDMTGGTALHWAAENNNLELCKLLLSRRANPNAYNFAGQPVLTMPILRRQQAVRKLLLQNGADLTFAQDFINTKLLGHMFELVGTADLVDPANNYVEVNFEGFYLEFSIGIIADSLAQFQNHFAARKLRRFSELAKLTLNVFQRASRLIRLQQYRIDIKNHEAEVDELIQHEPLLIPVGYEGHAITFIKLGNIFAKIDRREESRLYDNIMFYQVNNTQNFSQSFLKNLIYEKKSDHYVNNIMPEALRLAPITELKVDAQISGNCSWANVEAVIPAVFFLLLLASPESDKNISQYKSMAIDYFNQWREWNKDRALHFCIESFKDSDTIRNVCKAEILAAILYQRCDYETSLGRERFETILEVLKQPPYDSVLQNYIRSYCYESKSEEGQKFAQRLRMSGYL